MDRYVVHFCINTKTCNKAWLDLDLTNACTRPPKRYCPECISSGFINKKKDPKKILRGKYLAIRGKLSNATDKTAPPLVLAQAKLTFPELVEESTSFSSLASKLEAELQIFPAKNKILAYCTALIIGMQEAGNAG